MRAAIAGAALTAYVAFRTHLPTQAPSARKAVIPLDAIVVERRIPIAEAFYRWRKLYSRIRIGREAMVRCWPMQPVRDWLHRCGTYPNTSSTR